MKRKKVSRINRRDGAKCMGRSQIYEPIVPAVQCTLIVPRTRRKHTASNHRESGEEHTEVPALSH